MNIGNLFNEKKVVFSFEIFPPKTTSSVDTIYKTLEALKGLSPDYMSVTFGAGGSMQDNRTIELSSLVKNTYGIEAVAHLTCISSTKNDIEYYLKRLKEENIENILALRGDAPADGKIIGEFNHANELMNFINNKGDFNIAGACYPEGHIENQGLYREIESMKRKEEAGASYFISQLFFDNNLFYKFQDEVLKANVTLPIEAGIMPVTSKAQIERMVALSGAALPEKFRRIMDKFEHDPAALRDAGIAYATDQIIDLVSSGVQGIHLYVMNNPYVAEKISNSVGKIITSVNNEILV